MTLHLLASSPLRRALPLALAIAVAVLAASLVAKVKIQTQHDPSVDFSRFRTWAWNPDGRGSVIMAVTADDDPEAMRKRLEPALVPSITQELGRRGLAESTAGTPDLLVNYYALISVGSSAQTMGQFLSLPQWGLPPFVGATQSLDIVPQGTLVLDLGLPPKGQVVWRSVAQAEIHRNRTDAERGARLAEVVRDMLKAFPPKAKR